MIFIDKIKHLFSVRNTALVLMYHRISNNAVDPWSLAVSESNFEQQLDLLRQNYTIISVEELIEQLKDGFVGKNVICISFDDGYSDNYYKALPLLAKYGLPATIFISTGFINKHNGFWWDILTDIFLCSEQLPPRLEVTINNIAYDINLENSGRLEEVDFKHHQKWKWSQVPPTQRAQIYVDIWSRLKPMHFNVINDTIAQLCNWSGYHAIDTENYPMNEKQLYETAGYGRISLGIHTVNHLALGMQDFMTQEAEFEECSDYLSRFSNYINATAYPYGNYNRNTLEIMKIRNTRAAFTTEEKTINSKSDPYRLGRFQVQNWNRSDFHNQLINWLK